MPPAPPDAFPPVSAAAWASPGWRSRPPRLWLLDEPTNSLDDVNSRRLTALVRAHLDTGGLAIIATHIALGLDAATLRLRPSEAATSDPFLEGSLS